MHGCPTFCLDLAGRVLWLGILARGGCRISHDALGNGILWLPSSKFGSCCPHTVWWDAIVGKVWCWANWEMAACGEGG